MLCQTISPAQYRTPALYDPHYVGPPTVSFMRTHNPYYARSEYHTQLAKMSFDKIFDLTAGVYFHFLQHTLQHTLQQHTSQTTYQVT